MGIASKTDQQQNLIFTNPAVELLQQQ